MSNLIADKNIIAMASTDVASNLIRFFIIVRQNACHQIFYSTRGERLTLSAERVRSYFLALQKNTSPSTTKLQ